MSHPIGTSGLARAALSMAVLSVSFKKTTAETKIIALDPSKNYGLFCSGAGPSDVLVYATKDSKDAVSNGTAVYTAVKTYTAMAAAGGYIGELKNCTAVKVTHTKSGSGTDDAAKVTALGGRFQVRAMEGATGADTGLGSYTALTAT